MKRKRANLEVASKARITPEGKAQADSKAQHTRQYVSISRGPQRSHRALDGVVKPLLLILIGGVVCCGCAAVMIGAGAGAGAAAYIKGKVTQTYDSDYLNTVQASIEVLNTLKLPVSEKTSDKSKTLIRAEHADGTPVTVEVVPLGPGQTEVGVRTGALGISNSELEGSEQIQAGIKKQLAKLALQGSKAAEMPAALTQPEPVEEAPRAMAVSRTALERDRPISTLAASKKTAPEFTIYFNRDSNELLQSEIVKLNQIVEAFAQKPGLKLILNGYSDSLGSMEYNRMISESRASTVKMYLAGKGVDPSRITVVGHGAINFAASNADEESRQMNRRVEISLVGN